jgi:outer membrane protein TolC
MRGLTIAVALAALSTAAGAAPPRRLSLPDAVDLALRSDPVLAAARVGVERAENAVLRAQLDRVSVRVDGSLQELFNKSNIGGPAIYTCTLGPTTFNADPETCTGMGGVSSLSPDQTPQRGLGTFNLSANVNVPIFSGLRVESNVAMRQRQRDFAHVNIRQTKKDTALAVARAYWGVRRLGLLVEVQEHTIARLRDAELVTDARVRAGLAAPIDKNRATLRRLQRAATAADQLGQLRETTAQLAVALGLPPGEEIVLTDAPQTNVVVRPPPVEDLLADARSGRPELRLARLNSEAQRYAVRIAQSGYYPQLNGTLLFQLGNNPYNPVSGARGVNDTANPFSNISGTLTTGFSLSMNFFDMLNTWTASRDAKYELARLREEERRFGRVVENDVRVAWARIDRLVTRREALVAAYEVARDNLVILEARYKNGDALVIEYLDGQIELANAELELADNLAQLQLAWIELQAALGKIVGVES